MSPAALDNANPTILNPSELPTRKQTFIHRNGPDSKYKDVIFARPSYISSPFCCDGDGDGDGDGNGDGDNHGDNDAATMASFWPCDGADDRDDDYHGDEPIDEQEIYDLISTITDPEHPVSLGQLSVINLADIRLRPLLSASGGSNSHSRRRRGWGRGPLETAADTDDDDDDDDDDNNNNNNNTLVEVSVEITPTITHCSLATILGLAVRVRLEHTLPPNYRVDVRCKQSSHVQDDQVNKQLADKERVAAALENDSLRSVLDKMLETCR